MQLLFETFSTTDTGRVRQRNEDSYLEASIEIDGNRGILLVVADGIGGHRAGDVASRTATETIGEYFKRFHTFRNCFPEEPFIEANNTIRKMSADDPHLSGMGTTLTALLLFNGYACIAHAGDSRAYLIRKGSIVQLTTDHTLEQKMKDSGTEDKEEIMSVYYSHILTNAVGTEDNILIERPTPLKTEDSDIYLLCSDGLTSHVKDSEINSIAGKNDPGTACKILVDTANERGGSDNITILIARIGHSYRKK